MKERHQLGAKFDFIRSNHASSSGKTISLAQMDLRSRHSLAAYAAISIWQSIANRHYITELEENRNIL